MSEVVLNGNGKNQLLRIRNATAQTFARFMNADYNACLPKAVVKRWTYTSGKTKKVKSPRYLNGAKKGQFKPEFGAGTPFHWQDQLPGNYRITKDASPDGRTPHKVPFFLITMPDPGRYNKLIPTAKAGLKDFGKGWMNKMEYGGTSTSRTNEMHYLFELINNNLASQGPKKP